MSNIHSGETWYEKNNVQHNLGLNHHQEGQYKVSVYTDFQTAQDLYNRVIPEYMDTQGFKQNS